ncbi:hypothetical protein ACSX1A_04510 [Pontibacter sp. MBLB2868]|uniref:hypothetical protein n=1 Tax=Pontibacter sp. MBLB2868 TaxID=3451555 RepID=UPI003F75310F
MSTNTKSGGVYLQLWLFMLLISVCWQDFILVNKLGEIARNPIFLFFPIFVLTEFLNLSKYKTRQFISVNNLFFYFIFGILCISIIYLCYWFISDKPTVILGEHVAIKSIKILLYYVLLWLFFRHIYFVLSAIGDPKKIGSVFYWVIFLHLIIILIELYTIPHALPFLHSLGDTYYRVRLLTVESSFTGGVVVMLLTTAITCTLYIADKAKRKKRLFVIVAFFVIYVLATTSKMFLVTSLACTTILILTTFKLNYKYLVAGLIFFIISVIFIYPKLEAAFVKDINYYTSTITRTGAYINGYLIAFHHPLGTGGVYFYYFMKYLDNSLQIVTSIFGGGDTSEILTWGVKNDKAIATGAEFSLWLAILGIPGGLLFIAIHYKLIIYSRLHLFIYWGMIYFTITSFFSEIIMAKPNVILFWALILYFLRIKIEKLSYDK